jgi:quercetin dioxygenase-like cupin family protein
LGHVWLLTIDVAGWRPLGGKRVADIGALPVSAGVPYVSEYMEAVFTPGMTTPVHRHPVPEAWYTVSGETCLETPEGKMVGRAGGAPVIVPGGPPMHLTATGTEIRRALVLILGFQEHLAENVRLEMMTDELTVFFSVRTDT